MFNHTKFYHLEQSIYMLENQNDPEKKRSWYICTIYSTEIAQEIVELLEYVTGCEPLRNWDRKTWKRVYRIARTVKRINNRKHTYPIPFESLKETLGMFLAEWATIESYKRMVGVFNYRLHIAKSEIEQLDNQKEYNKEKREIEKYMLYQFFQWVEDVNGLGDLINKGIVKPNLEPDLLNLED